MQAPILLPDIGAAPVKLSLWYADVGEHVFEGDQLVELIVGGATFDVAAPATGTLTEKCVRPDQALQPGETLGRICVEQRAGTGEGTKTDPGAA
jgi:pyruvate/2-oxoglutarate dehydrogenase complex dihydrolipoamide acyltransferase (E2) component